MSARGANAACCSGAAVSTVALLCCLSVGPVVAVLSAAGLGFLLTDAILVLLLILALGVTLWGLRLGARVHGGGGPLVAGGVGGVAAIAGLFVAPPVAYGGIVLVLAATVWSVVAIHRVRDRETGESHVGS